MALAFWGLFPGLPVGVEGSLRVCRFDLDGDRACSCSGSEDDPDVDAATDCGAVDDDAGADSDTDDEVDAFFPARCVR